MNISNRRRNFESFMNDRYTRKVFSNYGYFKPGDVVTIADSYWLERYTKESAERNIKRAEKYIIAEITENPNYQSKVMKKCFALHWLTNGKPSNGTMYIYNPKYLRKVKAEASE